MKKLLILLSLLSLFLISCEKTGKQSNQTRNPDTVVVKKDSAVKKSDTLGFSK